LIDLLEDFLFNFFKDLDFSKETYFSPFFSLFLEEEEFILIGSIFFPFSMVGLSYFLEF
jgi:hypothetical protein